MDTTKTDRPLRPLVPEEPSLLELARRARERSRALRGSALALSAVVGRDVAL